MAIGTPIKILVTGGTGMLGRAILRAMHDRGLTGAGVSSHECDITSTAGVQASLERHHPDVIINCAAYTKVDLAEKEPEQAAAVNAHGVAILAEAARRHRVRLIHISTDFVFDGKSHRPYQTSDSTAPLSEYGRSKLLGEQLLQQINPPGWLIARTAWLYGADGNCFPKTMVKLARAGKPLKVVADQTGAPTYTADLSEALLSLIQHDAMGLWHLTNAGQTTWHDFAQAVLKAYDLPHTPPALEKTTSMQWQQLHPESAIRPRYSVLDITPYQRLTGGAMRPWHDALRDFKSAWNGNS